MKSPNLSFNFMNKNSYLKLINHHYNLSQKSARHRLLSVSSKQPVLCGLHPALFHDLHQAVRLPFWGPTNAASFGKRSPLKNFMDPSVIVSASRVPSPLCLKLSNLINKTNQVIKLALMQSRTPHEASTISGTGPIH